MTKSAEPEEFYNNLKYAITRTYPSRDIGSDINDKNALDNFLNENEYMFDERVKNDAKELIVWLRKKLRLDDSTNGISKIQENTDPLVSKAWFIIFELFDLTGESLTDWVEDLLRADSNQTMQNIKENLKKVFVATEKDEAIRYADTAAAQIRLIIRICEQGYRTNKFEEGERLVKDLRKIIFENLIPNENRGLDIEYLSLLMMGLTEDTIIELQQNQIVTADRISSQMGVKTQSWISNLLEDAEEFLSLISRASLSLGKFLIRNNNFSNAEKLLGESIKLMVAWKEIKISKLKFSKKAGNLPKNLLQEINFIDNHTANRVAVAQLYLSYCYYRQGRFARATTQVIPAQLILSKTNWLFSKIFSDLIFASAERRLAGIHNTLQLNQIKRVNKNIINFFKEPNKNESEKKPNKNVNIFFENINEKEPGKGIERDPAFLLRAQYELGIYHYYNAEVMENIIETLAYKNADSEEKNSENYKLQLAEKFSDIYKELKEAEKWGKEIERYLDDMKSADKIYLGLKIEHFELFWRANAYHLLSFASMKEAVLRSKIRDVDKNNPKNSEQQIIELFSKSVGQIEIAEKANEQSGSWWQRVEISSDKGYILNAAARFYLSIGDKIKSRNHVKKALESLDKAWEFAEKMAKKETVRGISDPTPRSNFAGPIFLFRAESYAIYQDKKNSERFFREWQKVSNEVEYTRVRDLAPKIQVAIESIDEAFVLKSDSEDHMKYEKLEREFRKWLLKQATKDKTDSEAIDALGISKATFYLWKKDLAKDDKG